MKSKEEVMQKLGYAFTWYRSIYRYAGGLPEKPVLTGTSNNNVDLRFMKDGIVYRIDYSIGKWIDKKNEIYEYAIAKDITGREHIVKLINLLAGKVEIVKED